VSAETVSTPNTPSGPTTGATGMNYSYSSGGSASSLGHTVEYQFDWKGDGSDLSSWGSSTQSKGWTAASTYNVRARARCKTDTGMVSAWSNALTVNITAVPTPDLTGQWVSLTQTCKSTRGVNKCQVKGTFQVKNAGNKDISSSGSVNFYLSADGIFSADDTSLKQVSAGKLKKGGSKSISLSINLSSGVTASGKYVIAVIDQQDTISESNENNNQIAYGPVP